MNNFTFQHRDMYPYAYADDTIIVINEIEYELPCELISGPLPLVALIVINEIEYELCELISGPLPLVALK